jgi:hypothetical protein
MRAERLPDTTNPATFGGQPSASEVMPTMNVPYRGERVPLNAVSSSLARQ